MKRTASTRKITYTGPASATEVFRGLTRQEYWAQRAARLIGCDRSEIVGLEVGIGAKSFAHLKDGRKVEFASP